MRLSLLALLVLTTPAFAEEPVWRSPEIAEPAAAPPGAAAAASAAAPNSAPMVPCNSDNWNGDWDTEYGRVTLTVSGKAVEGDYEYLNGGIEGTLDESGCVLTGVWHQDPSHKDPADTGGLVFVLNSNGLGWAGTWTFTSDPNDPYEWNGTRPRDLTVDGKPLVLE